MCGLYRRMRRLDTCQVLFPPWRGVLFRGQNLSLPVVLQDICSSCETGRDSGGASLGCRGRPEARLEHEVGGTMTDWLLARLM